METVEGDSTATRRLAVPAGTVPAYVGSFALMEQAVGQFRRTGADSGVIHYLFPGAETLRAGFLVRAGADSVIIQFISGTGRARIDRRGRILGVDGAGSTYKVKVERLARVDLEELGRRFVAADDAGRALGALSPRDTVRATIAGARVHVDYGRPRRRGRVVFGGVVPWHTLWRTGANAPTRLTSDRALELGRFTLLAGDYLLQTLPSPTVVLLVLSRSPGPEADAPVELARVQMQVSTLADTVEQFTMGITPEPGGGTLAMEWELTLWSVGFSVK